MSEEQIDKKEKWISLEATFSGQLGENTIDLVKVNFYVPESKATDENRTRLDKAFGSFLEHYMDVVNSDKLKEAINKVAQKE